MFFIDTLLTIITYSLPPLGGWSLMTSQPPPGSVPGWDADPGHSARVGRRPRP